MTMPHRDEWQGPDEWEKNGGAHARVPFESESVAALQSIAMSLVSLEQSAKTVASVMVGIRDILRGRNEADEMVQSPIRAIAEIGQKMLLRPTHTASAQSAAPPNSAPPTQRPAQQAQPQTPPQKAPSANGKSVASDSDLDSQYGNPEVRVDLKRWPKQSYKGRKYSECDPEFLDMLADFLDWSAGESKKKIDAGSQDSNEIKRAKFGPIDAARARGWAARIRKKGFVAPAQTAPADDY